VSFDGEVATDARKDFSQRVLILPEMSYEKAAILNELAAAHSIPLYSTKREIRAMVWMEFTGTEPAADESWINKALDRAWAWTRSIL
jgi:hypothetical protein